MHHTPSCVVASYGMMHFLKTRSQQVLLAIPPLASTLVVPTLFQLGQHVPTNHPEVELGLALNASPLQVVPARKRPKRLKLVRQLPQRNVSWLPPQFREAANHNWHGCTGNLRLLETGRPDLRVIHCSGA